LATDAEDVEGGVYGLDAVEGVCDGGGVRLDGVVAEDVGEDLDAEFRREERGGGLWSFVGRCGMGSARFR
jgi:hypothetical protein